jgi:hypothetical protein
VKEISILRGNLQGFWEPTKDKIKSQLLGSVQMLGRKKKKKKSVDCFQREWERKPY